MNVLFDMPIPITQEKTLELEELTAACHDYLFCHSQDLQLIVRLATPADRVVYHSEQHKPPAERQCSPDVRDDHQALDPVASLRLACLFNKEGNPISEIDSSKTV